MRMLVIKSLETLAWIAIALIVLGGAASGAAQAGLGGLIAGLAGSLIVSIVVFGALFVLLDIAENTRRMAALLERPRGPESGGGA